MLFRLWQTVALKAWQDAPEGFYLICPLKKCQQAQNSWREAGITKYIPVSEFCSSPGTNIVGKGRKGRWIYGVTSSAVTHITKRRTVKSSEGHMVSEDLVLPWPWDNVLVVVLCIRFSCKQQSRWSVLLSENRVSNLALTGSRDHACPALRTGKWTSSWKVQACFHQKKDVLLQTQDCIILHSNSHSHLARVNGVNAWCEGGGWILFYAAQTAKLFYFM